MPPDTVAPAGMRRHLFRAMGTRVVVVLPVVHAAAAEGVRTLFAEWEAVLSRFDPGSELCRVNRAGGGEAGELLREVVSAALVAAWWTDGSFDPTLGV